MKCVDARHLIHLSVGDDTLPAEEQQLSDHLHVCSDCRAYNAGTVDAMHVLQSLRDDTPDNDPAPDSVWPAIADRIRSRSVQPARHVRQFNGAVAAVCACSLTLALVTIVQNLPVNTRPSYSGGAMPGSNVDWQPVGNLRPIDPNNPAAGYYDTTNRRIYAPTFPVSSGQPDF